MSEIVPPEPAAEAEAETTRKPMVKRFRRPFTTVRLAPEVAERHGKAVATAFKKFGNVQAVNAFMNHHDEDLGGRPLDIAGASAEGLAAVEQRIAAQTTPTT